MRDPFRILEDVREKEVRKIDRKHSDDGGEADIDELVRQAIDFIDKISGTQTMEKTYALAKEMVGERKITNNDINEFLAFIEDISKKDYRSDLGYFVSAMMNRAFECGAKSLTLDLRTIPQRMNSIGYSNKGDVTIIGDVGHCSFNFMEGGKASVQGSSGQYLGAHMSGGEIHISGKAEDYTGQKMRDGKIFISKESGPHTGYEMTGGSIDVSGTIKDFRAYEIITGEVCGKAYSNPRK